MPEREVCWCWQLFIWKLHLSEKFMVFLLVMSCSDSFQMKSSTYFNSSHWNPPVICFMDLKLTRNKRHNKRNKESMVHLKVMHFSFVVSFFGITFNLTVFLWLTWNNLHFCVHYLLFFLWSILFHYIWYQPLMCHFPDPPSRRRDAHPFPLSGHFYLAKEPQSCMK